MTGREVLDEHFPARRSVRVLTLSACRLNGMPTSSASALVKEHFRA
ncbi:hypothetical protein PSMK_30120 [Phycisphaera mikurensis NBRC 102666]|uniref:Uncharacterized protein n=1 Tax=Phycisphaera mikurensis (strain NBRC 102666 / KCTC 22515 / FYK2301M01) TaxID=1142394 RepID=I0IIT3_PHYMF|nr:hypothetical protein PSMK_30120 [Phycisphaera mikurensis NBRC 102666]